MINNDILRSLRYSLKLSDARMVKIFALGECEVTKEEARAKVGHEEDDDAIFCTDEELARFLDGLVLHKRGPRQDGTFPPPVVTEITNNMILKKLRIALMLREDDILSILKAGGQPMSRGELTALFRKPEHRSYREAGNQVLRKFLRGLTMRLRPEDVTQADTP